MLLARLQIESDLQALIDPSDVVQQTLLKAIRNWDQCRGATHAERAGWLRAILAREIADVARKIGRRGENRRRSASEAPEESSARLETWIQSDSTSPSARFGRQERVQRLAQALGSACFHPDGRRLAVTDHHANAIVLYDSFTGRDLRTLHGHRFSFNCVRCTPDGKKLSSAAWDGTLRIWNTETGGLCRTVGEDFRPGGPDKLDAALWLAVHPDGRRVACCFQQTRTVRVLDLETGETLWSVRGAALSGLFPLARTVVFCASRIRLPATGRA